MKDKFMRSLRSLRIKEFLKNINYKKSLIYLMILSSSILVICYFFNWLNYYNSVKDNIKESEKMLSFMGSFLGSLLSGVLSLSGVIATLTYYRNKDIANKLQAVLPNLSFSVVYLIRDYEFVRSDITFMIREDGVRANDPGLAIAAFVINVHNLGNGPAFDVDIKSLNKNTRYPYHHNLGVIENGKMHKRDFEIEFSYKELDGVELVHGTNDLSYLEYEMDENIIIEETAEVVKALDVIEETTEVIKALDIIEETTEVIKALDVTEETTEVIKALEVTEETTEVKTLDVTEETTDVIKTLDITKEIIEVIKTLDVEETIGITEQEDIIETNEEDVAEEYESEDDAFEGDLNIIKFESHIDCYFYDSFRNKYKQTIRLVLEYDRDGEEQILKLAGSDPDLSSDSTFDWNLYTYPDWPVLIKKSGK